MRKGMEAMDNAMNEALGPVSPEEEFYHDIPMRDGFESQLKVHKPASNTPPGPLIVLCFGGGFIGGTNSQLSKYARALVKLFGATVVNISYRLAPEYKFPIGQHDTEDNMKWIANNATGPVLTSDPKKGFIMGGVSAGGSLTSCYSRKFQEEPLAYPLTGQWLSIPSCVDTQNPPVKYKSYHLSASQLADSPFFSEKARDWLKELAEWDSDSPLRYAVNATTPLSGQPRTYFQVDGMDPLRDGALIYDEMLKEAGVETKVDIYPGCPHGHFHGYAGLEITDRANIDTMVGFGWLLGMEVSREEAKRELGL